MRVNDTTLIHGSAVRKGGVLINSRCTNVRYKVRCSKQNRLFDHLVGGQK